jgi:hypothetical protein
VGALKTSDQGDVVAGEGSKDARINEDRPVDAGAKIIISAGPIADAARPVAPVAPATRPHRPSQPHAIGQPRRGGLWLVVLLYLLSAGALAYAIYERFLA